MAANGYSPETGTKDDVVSVDSSVTAGLSNDVFEVDVKADKFCDEIYTLDYISNVFSNLQNVFTCCQQLINSAIKYVKNADEADQITMPDIAEFNFSFSGIEEFNQAHAESFNNMLGVVAVQEGSSLNLRSGAGTNNSIIRSLSKDTKLKIINNDSTSNWIEVETEDGTKGFVYRKYLNLKDQSLYVEPMSEINPDIYLGVQKVVLNSGYLNVRSDPSTNNNPIGSLQNGAEINVIGVKNGWAKIKYNNQEAYVAAKYLSGGR